MTIEKLTSELCAQIAALPFSEKIEALNSVRAALHEISPFKDEPVDYVKWVPSVEVEANSHNPNFVSKPEMDLLYLSIKEDGITMPIVAMEKPEGGHQIVDGFHRNKTITIRPDIANRTHGYTPVSIINKTLAEWVASMVRHNRARGEHETERMAEIAALMTNEGCTNTEIAKALGMEPEEVLRLKQVKGVAVALANRHYDRAWEVVLDAEVKIAKP